MIPLLAVFLTLASSASASSVWSTTIPFTPGRSVTLDARAASLLVSSLEMADRSNGRQTATTLTVTAANVGEEDAEALITATLLDAQGAALAVEDESVEIEEGDVKKVRFRVAVPPQKKGPIASVKLAITLE